MRPYHAILIAFAIALMANVFIFRTYTELSEVAAYSVFANCMVVLTMVPLYTVLRLRAGDLESQMPSRVKTSVKAVAAFALLVGMLGFVLFNTLGDYLIGERMALLVERLAASDLTAEEQARHISSAERIYSPGVQVLFSTMAVLFTGFISAIVAGVAVRR
ncbi:MAG: hypothetical protein K9J06_13945 [Flavobacteriales bacterium]|nr:hypothetical protein [Flavobacteriales bacterium]